MLRLSVKCRSGLNNNTWQESLPSLKQQNASLCTQGMVGERQKQWPPMIMAHETTVKNFECGFLVDLESRHACTSNKSGCSHSTSSLQHMPIRNRANAAGASLCWGPQMKTGLLCSDFDTWKRTVVCQFQQQGSS